MKILNIYLRNKDADISFGNYYGIYKFPDIQLYTIYKRTYREEITIYLSKEYVYRTDIYHKGNRNTFMYKSRLYI